MCFIVLEVNNGTMGKEALDILVYMYSRNKISLHAARSNSNSCVTPVSSSFPEAFSIYGDTFRRWNSGTVEMLNVDC